MLSPSPSARHAAPRFFSLDPLEPASFPDFPVLADLVAFVASLDLLPLRQSYRGFGSDAWPVDRLLILALFHTHHGQPSPALWHRQAQSHQGLRRLLQGFVPARSTLYAFRDRLAGPLREIHQHWLRRQRPRHPHLGEQIGLDGTFIALQASRHTLLTERGLRCRLQTIELQRLGAELTSSLGPAALAVLAPLLWWLITLYCRSHDLPWPRPCPAWLATTPSGRRRQEQRYREALRVLRERPRSEYARRRRRRHQAPRISPSAPRALLGRDKHQVYRPLVNAQITVDLGSGLVTSLALVPQVNDANQLLPMSQASATACGVPPRQVSVDSGYVQLLSLRGAAAQNLAVFSSAAPPGAGAKEPAKKFTPRDFVWEPERRGYRCPEGQELAYLRDSWARRAGEERVELELYRAPGAVCGACPQSSRCTTNPSRGRVIKRLKEEELREACRERSESGLGERLRMARRSQVERVFGDWKEHRGQSRICGRSTAAAGGQLGLTLLYFNARSTFTHSLN